MDGHPAGELGQLFERQHLPTADLRPDLGRVGIEGRQDVEAELGEPLVAQQRPAEAAGTHQKGVVGVVPAEEILNGLNKLRDLVAGLGASDDGCALQVLADLRRIEPELSSNNAARDESGAGLLVFLQEVMIAGKPAKGWFRDDLIPPIRH
jgi:hypothetical protein